MYEPVGEFGATLIREGVDQPVGAGVLGLAVGLGESVAGESLQELVEVADVKGAEVGAGEVVELVLEVVAVARPLGEEREHRVMERHRLSVAPQPLA